MIDLRFTCQCPQYHFCGNYSCSLSKYCAEFPLYQLRITQDLRVSKKNRLSLTKEETKEHERRYRYYNRLWGQLRTKQIAFSRNYYKTHRKEILAKKRRPVSYTLPVVYKEQCTFQNCQECPYPDCQLELYKDVKEYQHLYYNVFHEKLLAQKSEYRQLHRQQLSNTEKLRNYKKKGYLIRESVFITGPTPEFSDFCGKTGYICIIPINRKPYLSFISIDKETSMRAKIIRCEGELEDNGCNSFVVYSDSGREFSFKLKPLDL